VDIGPSRCTTQGIGGPCLRVPLCQRLGSLYTLHSWFLIIVYDGISILLIWFAPGFTMLLDTNTKLALPEYL